MNAGKVQFYVLLILSSFLGWVQLPILLFFHTKEFVKFASRENTYSENSLSKPAFRSYLIRHTIATTLYYPLILILIVGYTLTVIGLKKRKVSYIKAFITICILLIPCSQVIRIFYILRNQVHLGTSFWEELSLGHVMFDIFAEFYYILAFCFVDDAAKAYFTSITTGKQLPWWSKSEMRIIKQQEEMAQQQSMAAIKVIIVPALPTTASAAE